MTFTTNQWISSVEKLVAILKKRFPNLTTEETLKLAHEITKAIAISVEETI